MKIGCRIATLSSLLLAAFLTQHSQGATPQAPKGDPLPATVITAEGRTNSVDSFFACFQAEGLWQGQTPTSYSFDLKLRLVPTNATQKSEVLTVRLRDVTRMAFDWKSTERSNSWQPLRSWTLHLRSGGQIIVTPDRITQKDKNGVVTTDTPLNRFLIQDGQVSGFAAATGAMPQNMALMWFIGVVGTSESLYSPSQIRDVVFR